MKELNPSPLRTVLARLIAASFFYLVLALFFHARTPMPKNSGVEVLASFQGDLSQFSNFTEIVFSLLTKLFVIALVTIAIIFIIRVLADKSYTIQQINVPPSFEESGHSGPVIANSIYERLNEIIRKVSAAEYAKGYSTSTLEKDVAVDVGGMGLPVKAFIELIGKTLGIKNKKKIDADIFIEGSRVVMVLRITGEPSERFEATLNTDVGMPVKTLVHQVSESILKYSNDEALQTFFGHIERDGEKAAKLAKFRLEKYRGNKFMEARMVSAWGRGLCLMKRYEEAAEKIQQGITLNPNEGRLYNVWGLMLQEQGKHDDAKEKLMKAFGLMKPNESKFRRANALTAIGLSSSRLGQSSVAVEYYQKAIAVDNNAHLSYYYLAKEYLRNGNEAMFLDHLEKSLARGLRSQVVLQDPDLSSRVDDVAVNRLIAKYAED